MRKNLNKTYTCRHVATHCEIDIDKILRMLRVTKKATEKATHEDKLFMIFNKPIEWSKQTNF